MGPPEPDEAPEVPPDPEAASGRADGGGGEPGALSFRPRPYTARQRVRLLLIILGLSGLVVLPCVGAGALPQLALGSSLPPWTMAAITIGAMCGMPAVAALALLVVVLDVHRRHRSARVDRRAVVFGSSPVGAATRVPWERVRSFTIIGDGVMLHLGGVWSLTSRWLGPTVFCEGAEVHALVLLLEELEVPRRED